MKKPFGIMKQYHFDLVFVEIDECAQVTCYHNSTCLDYINAFSCNCSVGYTGVFCESSKFIYLAIFSSIRMKNFSINLHQTSYSVIKTEHNALEHSN